MSFQSVHTCTYPPPFFKENFTQCWDICPGYSVVVDLLNTTYIQNPISQPINTMENKKHNS